MMMTIQPDAHWIADESEDDHASDTWSVEDIDGEQDARRRLPDCEWFDIDKERNGASTGGNEEDGGPTPANHMPKFNVLDNPSGRMHFGERR